VGARRAVLGDRNVSAAGPEVGRRIALLRRRLGLSQVAFARQARITDLAGCGVWRPPGSGAAACRAWRSGRGRAQDVEDSGGLETLRKGGYM
jgi:hypothetical protein